jgi:hypothetical protein
LAHIPATGLQLPVKTRRVGVHTKGICPVFTKEQSNRNLSLHSRKKAAAQKNRNAFFHMYHLKKYLRRSAILMVRPFPCLRYEKSGITMAEICPRNDA